MARSDFHSQTSDYFFGVGRYRLLIEEESEPYNMKDGETNWTNNVTFDHTHIINGSTKVYTRHAISHSTVNGNDLDNNITGAYKTHKHWSHNVGLSSYEFENVVYRWDGTFNDSINGAGGNDLIEGWKGDDVLNGGNDNDALHGGEGTDTLNGGNGSDLLYTGPLTNGESDVLTGGAGGDTFFLGDASTPSGPHTTGKGFDWGRLGLSLAGDVSDLLFTVVPGLGTAGKIAKEIVPMMFDVAKATSHNVTATVAQNGGEKGSATITDFNPVEDVIFIPLPSDGDIYIDKNTTDNGLLKVFHDKNNTDVIATVKLSNDFNNIEGNSNGKLESNLFKNIERNALILDSKGAKDFKNKTKLEIEDSQLEDLGTNKFLVLGAYSGFDIKGANGADYSYGTQFGDIISGYEEPEKAYTAGDDVFYGFGGNDVFFPGQGNDRIYGGDGVDAVNYMDSTSAITINLSNGNNNDDGFRTKDRLHSIENIIGSDYGDRITGDGQANVLNGGQGTDTLRGGAGADTFAVQATEGDVIKDFNVNEDKLLIPGMNQGDRRDYKYNSSNSELSLFIWGRPVAVLENIPEGQVNNVVDNIKVDFVNEIVETREAKVNGENKTITETRVETKSATGGWAEHSGIFITTGSSTNDSLTGVDGQGYIIAGHGGNDTITGGDSGEWMWGGSGNDSLIGGSLYDQMFGGDGNDTLIGNDHVDRLYGNAGDDYLNGGNGGDFFILNSDIGIDTIADFNANEGDKFLIDKNVYGISDLNGISYDANSGELSANGNNIAVLNNPVGFAVNDTNISLRENLIVD
ncbi:calcium-binding protein [Dapis sp. BLCC M126]|uniref:calcium-binding protein n=1 Tax=Dapis sp. BLCC M126 TaxID=3400189 RepID=UPI003CF80662